MKHENKNCDDIVKLRDKYKEEIKKHRIREKLEKKKEELKKNISITTKYMSILNEIDEYKQYLSDFDKLNVLTDDCVKNVEKDFSKKECLAYIQSIDTWNNELLKYHFFVTGRMKKQRSFVSDIMDDYKNKCY